MTKTQKISLAVFSVLLSATAALSGFMVYTQLSGLQKEKEEFAELAELVQKVQPEPSRPDGTPSTGNRPGSAQKRDLTPLFAQNSDCIGWLCIPGTAVNYPVMHTPQEQQRYLRRNFCGEYSQSGVPFLDWRCGLQSDHLSIYGHNMKNGTMFSSVTGYADEEYQKEHPVIELETPDGIRTYRVFAAAAVKKTDAWYAFLAAETEEIYQKAVTEMLAKARYDTGIVPVFGRQLLTLSTCYGQNHDDRLIVTAVCEDEISKTTLSPK